MKIHMYRVWVPDEHDEVFQKFMDSINAEYDWQDMTE